jgi:mannose-6-phosphate isomerase-like protein (cupin superfamily)
VGGPAIVRARTEGTAGALALIEDTVPPKEGPPFHVHAKEDEMWVVQKGNLRFKVDAWMLRAPVGSVVFVPRGARHCFQNMSEEAAQILVLFTPSGMERFFEELARLPPGPIDPQTYRSIAHASWMEVVGPPLAESDPH